MEYTLTPISPHSGRALSQKSDCLYTDGTYEYPEVDGILYLRDNDALREQVVAAIHDDDIARARTLLLRDQDRFSPTEPPAAEALPQLWEDPSLTLRDAMNVLNYGPVADYFAHRWSTSTFMSGLALLESCVKAGEPVIEVACGIGHFLRHLERHSVWCVGIDIVYSKLWLARHYMQVECPLYCGNIEASPVVQHESRSSVFCHDAFYFFEKQRVALDHMRGIANGGCIAVGHVHTTAVDHNIAGYPKSVAEYAAMASDNAVFADDAQLMRDWLSYGNATFEPADTLGECEAIGWIEGDYNSPRQPLDKHTDQLKRNPLLDDDGEVRYPSPKFELEYGPDADYLTTDLGDQASDEERYRHRQSLDLPRRW